MKRRIVLPALAALIAVSACTKPTSNSINSTTTSGGMDPRNLASSGSYLLPACADIKAPPPDTQYAYSITLTKKFLLRDAEVDIKGTLATPAPGKKKATRLDLSTIIPSGHSGRITIILDDKPLLFQDSPLGIRGGDANSQKVFCDVNYDSPTQISFTAYHDPTTNSATYNLGLIVSDTANSTYQLPIFIDPEVDNEG